MAGMFILAVFVSGVSAEVGEETARVQEEVERLKGHLKEQKESMQEVARKEKVIFDEFERSGKMLSDARWEERKVNKKLGEVEGEISRLNAQLEEARARVTSGAEVVGARLRAMYKQGRHGYYSSIFASDTHASALRHYRSLSLVAEHDQKLLENFSKATAEALSKFAELEAQKKELVPLQEEASRKSAEVAQRLKEKKDLLATIRKEKSFYASVVKGLEESSTYLEAILKEAKKAPEKTQTAPPSVSAAVSPPAASAPVHAARKDASVKGAERPSAFSAAKGRLIWPAAGEVVGRFGRYVDSQTKEQTIRKGVEIAAAAGSEVSAVFRGNVIYSNWLKGYGKAVILDHGETYYTVYAHLADILVREGDSVDQGALIGKVGDTGSLKGPDLYFEVRNGGDPEDPILWLKRR